MRNFGCTLTYMPTRWLRQILDFDDNEVATLPSLAQCTTLRELRLSRNLVEARSLALAPLGIQFDRIGVKTSRLNYITERKSSALCQVPFVKCNCKKVPIRMADYPAGNL
jgi:hypothetical protein